VAAILHPWALKRPPAILPDGVSPAILYPKY
jgi:hypothetical protein